jgi:hypothetical protein
MRKLLGAVLLATTVVLAGTSVVLADKVYHTERLGFVLTPDGADAGHPDLRSGQVVNIHPNGPVVGAIEKYRVNGALASTDYDVVLHVDTGACNGVLDFDLNTAVLSTDAHGNGHADFVFAPSALAGLSGCTVEAYWTLDVEGMAVYTTAQTVVVLD